MSIRAAGIRRWAKTTFSKRRPEPSYPTLPLVNDRGDSNIKGLTMIGEVAGTPLIKLGLNAGVEAIERLHKDLGASDADADLLDVLIVGAGSSGLGAALRAHELGMRYLVLESERIAMTVVRMFKGKHLFAEPQSAPNKSKMWFEECTREELLAKWRAQIEFEGLHINEFEKVVDIQRRGDTFAVESAKGSYRARRVLFAVGKAGNPRKAGVPGETSHPEKVLHHFSDPAEYQGQSIFIYGGGDVAAEAALALCGHNQVTMITIDEALVYPKRRNVEALMAQQEAGNLTLHLKSQLVDFDERSVTFKTGDGRQQQIDNDVVFEMIGAVLPLKFFKRVGIKLEGTWDWKRYLYAFLVFLAVYTLYALKKFPEAPYSWPFYLFMTEESFAAVTQTIFDAGFLPFRWLFSPEAYAYMRTKLWFQQGYLYSLIYTVVMVVFGVKAMRRWMSAASNPRYQKWRYITLVTFQVGFFLIVNVLAVKALATEYNYQLAVDNSWRAWGLYAPWPLFFNTFHWWSDGHPDLLLYIFAGMGVLGFLVLIPLASRRHGKRFCTWICGCGGLAETLGDRWRHLSQKGARSRSWNFQGYVVLLAAILVTVVTVGAFGGRADNTWAKAYSYSVDFWLVAVIPVALYPFFGGKVWCRYWCPLAAWNGFWSKLIGKLKIKSNDKCITCTLCSRYCQVGVDVMAFAKNQQPFDNRNSNCIQCGICIDVCPMDVLSFNTEDGAEVQLQIS